MWFDDYSNIFLIPKNKSVTKIAKYKNNKMFQLYFMKFLQDALYRYKFVGLPDTCSERVILQSLAWYGSVVFFIKDGNVLALPGMPNGQGLNAYGDFGGAYCYTANGNVFDVNLYMQGADESRFLNETVMGTQVKDQTGFLIRENPQMFPFIETVWSFADAVADSMRMLDVCRANAKRPYLITCEQSVINTVKSYFKQVDNNENFIISSGVFPVDKVNITALDSNPEFIRAATALIDWYNQKFREHCGILNQGSATDKKGENLNSAEITQNNSYTFQSVDQCVAYINNQLDDMNKFLGTNIRCERIEKIYNAYPEDLQKGGVIDGSDNLGTRTSD